MAATTTYHLPRGLLSALCYTESHDNPSAINPDDRGGPSRGVCQVKEQTARLMGFRGATSLLMRPSVNIEYSARYLRYQLVRYHGNVIRAIAAYNSGTYREGPDGLPKNRGYVLKVLRAQREHR